VDGNAVALQGLDLPLDRPLVARAQSNAWGPNPGQPGLAVRAPSAETRGGDIDSAGGQGPGLARKPVKSVSPQAVGRSGSAVG